jgi:hypothetical protein
MASSEVVNLAKKGDSGAIAVVMNEITQPKGILVRVQYQGDCLHILFQGAQIPKQQTAVSLVRAVLKQLNLQWHRSVMVYGRQQGSHHTSWHEALQLESYFELDPDAQITEQMDEPESTLAAEPKPIDEPILQGNLPVPETAAPELSQDAVASADLDQVELEQPEVAIDPEPDLELSKTELLDPESVTPLPQNWTTPTPPPENHMETSLVARPETALAETSEIPEFLKRPESVVFIFFTTVFVFWEAYLSLLNELAPATSLSCRQLADRLKVSKSTVRKRKRQPGFSDWSKSLDPDGIAWVYETGGLYRPQG